MTASRHIHQISSVTICVDLIFAYIFDFCSIFVWFKFVSVFHFPFLFFEFILFINRFAYHFKIIAFNQTPKSIVPGAPPRNITAEATSPTTIAMSWQPPPIDRSNGRIVYYKVFLVENGRSDSEASVTTLNATSIVLDELKRWTEYKIWVLAGTSVGDGPRSYPMTVRTHEDGMYLV